MQEEVIKHTEIIYDTVKNPKHTVGGKVIKIIIEIFIIVFAVTLSISLHSWNEHKHEQKEARKFLMGLKEDIHKDILLLQENKKTISILDSNFNFLLSVNKEQPTTELLTNEIHRHLIYNLTSTHLNIGRYDGFKFSGKIETIENDSLKEDILKFYQQTVIELTGLEQFTNSLQLKIMDLSFDRNDILSMKDFVTTRKMRGLLWNCSHNFEQLIQDYDKAIKQAKEIISGIENEISE